MLPIGGRPSVGIGPQDLGRTSGRAGSHDQGDGESRRWDPDDPWETDEGVSPVVRPQEDRGPVDPGPAIGFDR